MRELRCRSCVRSELRMCPTGSQVPTLVGHALSVHVTSRTVIAEKDIRPAFELVEVF